MRRIELRAFRMQSEHSTTELHPPCKNLKSIKLYIYIRLFFWKSQFENIFNNIFLGEKEKIRLLLPT